MAHMYGREEPKCKLCDSTEAGQRHLALHCPATQSVRDKPAYRRLNLVPSCTRCTGIPCRESAWCPLQWPSKVKYPCGLVPQYIFTDGSASPPRVPSVRLLSWAVVGSQRPDQGFSPLCSGLTPGYIHNIARAETFIALRAIGPRVYLIH